MHESGAAAAEPASSSRLQVNAVVACAVLLLLLNLLVNFCMLQPVNAQGVLSGEETSVSFRDAALLPTRIQHNPMATNFGGHLYYYLMSHIMPRVDLFYGRSAKAVAMATIAPLIFLIAVSILRLRPLICFSVGVLACVLPGVFSFSWVATEYGLGCPFGLLAILMASRRGKATAILAALLAGLSATIFASGLCFVPVALYLVYRRLYGTSRRPWLFLAALLILSVAVIAFPSFWWTNSHHILLGGGQLSSPGQTWSNFKQLLTECSLHGESYYYACPYAALSSPVLWGSTVLGMAWTIRRRQALWLWISLAGAVAIYLASGQIPGMRRGVPIVLFCVLFAGVFFDGLADARLRVVSLMAPVLILVSLIWAGTQAYKTRQMFADGMAVLQVDFRFAVPEGKTMQQMYETFLEHPENFAQNAEFYEPERTIAVLHVLASRNDRKARVIFTRELLLQAVKGRHDAIAEMEKRRAGSGGPG
jgi:hypothetical protein